MSAHLSCLGRNTDVWSEIFYLRTAVIPTSPRSHLTPLPPHPSAEWNLFKVDAHVPCVDFIRTLCTVGLSCILADAVIKAHKDVDTHSREHQNKYNNNEKYLRIQKGKWLVKENLKRSGDIWKVETWKMKLWNLVDDNENVNQLENKGNCTSCRH